MMADMTTSKNALTCRMISPFVKLNGNEKKQHRIESIEIEFGKCTTKNQPSFFGSQINKEPMQNQWQHCHESQIQPIICRWIIFTFFTRTVFMRCIHAISSWAGTAIHIPWHRHIFQQLSATIKSRTF